MQVVLKGFLYIVFFLVAITIIAALLLMPGASNKRTAQGLNIRINNEKTGGSGSAAAVSSDTEKDNSTSAMREEVLKRAKEMAEVKWTPAKDLPGWDNTYVFKSGVTYSGIPYSMELSQATSAADFLEHFNKSPKLYGNDCSGFVSAAWGISRQTTLTLYKAAKSGTKVDGSAVEEVSWEDLKPGDALLRENGKGKGHIVLFIASDSTDNDKLQVYEQNVPTVVPYQPFPTAREDIRSEKTMKEEGYFPIRLMSLK